MKTKLIFLPALCITLLSGCGETKEVADMIVVANQIYTANEKGEFADAIAIKDGKYIYVGNIEGAKKYAGDITSYYSTEFIMPSGVEAHAHFLLEQAFMDSCYITRKVNGVYRSKADVLGDIEKYAEENGFTGAEGEHLFGYGYGQIQLFNPFEGGRGYCRQDLDNICGGALANIPIYIAEESLHEAWVNTCTLERAGIAMQLKEGEKDPIVGILRDEDGYPTGVLTNEAVTYLLQKGFRYPICSDIGYKKVVKNTSEYLNSMGYTMHYDAWTNFDGTDLIYKALHDIDKANELTCVYTGSYNIATFEYRTSKLDDILNKIVDIRNNYKSDRFDPKYIKLFADGVLETGTGFLKEPYSAVYTGTGEQIWQQDDMNKIVLEANKKDLLVHTHTLGDASAAESIQSFVYSNNQLGKKTRNSLGHCCLVDDEDIAYLKDNEIGSAVNAGWLTETGDGFDLHATIVGQERAKDLYPYDKMLRAGAKPAISTDRPCTEGPIDIFDYMASIVLGYPSDLTNQVARRELNVSVKDAIDMLTINGAWMANYEGTRGSIEVGKFADFVTAKHSPFYCNPRLIKDINIEATCFEGKFVYFNK